MPPKARHSRAQPWLEGLGDWAWPGTHPAPEHSPPPWVPARPPQLSPAMAGPGAQALPAARSRAWRLALAMLLAALATVWVTLALGGPVAVERLVGLGPEPWHWTLHPGAVHAPPELLQDAPPLTEVAFDRAGSQIDHVSFVSGSLENEGSFYVYLPPGYASSARAYPVLYLLHGRDGHAQAFLEIGIQKSLDRLIDAGRIPPLIAVMVQDAPGLDNWRDVGARHSATYVIEVQQLVDRMLRTIPTRAARAIAGSSMGGFGAMNVALAYPLSFSVVESWLGFFNGLEGNLQSDRGVISKLGLHAFLYGASEDPVAVPSEDPEFAAELRAAGAQASGMIYPGGHSLEKVEEHLDTGLLFAGRSLRETQQRAAGEAGVTPGA